MAWTETVLRVFILFFYNRLHECQGFYWGVAEHSCLFVCFFYFLFFILCHVSGQSVPDIWKAQCPRSSGPLTINICSKSWSPTAQWKGVLLQKHVRYFSHYCKLTFCLYKAKLRYFYLLVKYKQKAAGRGIIIPRPENTHFNGPQPTAGDRQAWIGKEVEKKNSNKKMITPEI